MDCASDLTKTLLLSHSRCLSPRRWERGMQVDDSLRVVDESSRGEGGIVPPLNDQEPMSNKQQMTKNQSPTGTFAYIYAQITLYSQSPQQSAIDNPCPPKCRL